MTTTTNESLEVPFGLDGVVVAATSVGDVRGREGFFHYRQYSAVELAVSRRFEDVWFLFDTGHLPDARESHSFAMQTAPMRVLTDEVTAVLRLVAPQADPLAVMRSAASVLGAESQWRPIIDTDDAELRRQMLRLVSVAPTIAAATWSLANGTEPIAPDPELGFVANYLTMLTGTAPSAEQVHAIEQYLILVIDHGFNASTFTARVVASTGADLSASITAAIGALSGPLHGGAPSRVLDMLDAIATPDRTEAFVRATIERGDKIMGFGHRVYKTDDPRSVHLKSVARSIDAPLAEFAELVETTVTALLAELKPGRELFANAEFYAGVVMDAVGIPRPMFTPTFAIARLVGWCAHIAEQKQAARIIRPSSRYVGPPAPEPVPLP